MELSQKKDQLVEELALFPDPQERLAYLIEKARAMPPLDPEYKIEAFLVEGCQSQLWLVPRFEDGKCHFSTDSDAVITKGIAGILTNLYSDAPPADILAIVPDFPAESGTTHHLTPTRRNGLSNVWKKIRAFAESCQDEVASNSN